MQMHDGARPKDLPSLLSGLSLDHLAPSLEAHELQELVGRCGADRVQFLKELKEEFGVAKLPERQKLANALQKLAKRAFVGWTDETVAATRADDALAPLMVRATYGMGNQLRVLLSYRAVAQQQGRALVMQWSPHAACPGRFAELFEPIDGCIVVDSLAELGDCRAEWRRLAQASEGAIGATAYTQPTIEGTEQETEMWHVLRPRPAVQAAVEERLKALGDRFVACHVRRTDHKLGGASHEGERTTDDDFNRFVEAHGALPIFLATDNAPTQQRFDAWYGERVRGLKRITHEVAIQPHEFPSGDAGGGVHSTDEAFRCRDVHRHTPLFDAVVELFTCVHATTFKGCFYSSFSDAIMRLRLARGTASDADEHDLTVPSWHAAYAGMQYDHSIAMDHPKLQAYVDALGGADATAAAHSSFSAAHEALEALQQDRREQARRAGGTSDTR